MFHTWHKCYSDRKLTHEEFHNLQYFTKDARRVSELEENLLTINYVITELTGDNDFETINNNMSEITDTRLEEGARIRKTEYPAIMGKPMHQHISMYADECVLVCYADGRKVIYKVRSGMDDMVIDDQYLMIVYIPVEKVRNINTRTAEMLEMMKELLRVKNPEVGNAISRISAMPESAYGIPGKFISLTVSLNTPDWHGRQVVLTTLNKEFGDIVTDVILVSDSTDSAITE